MLVKKECGIRNTTVVATLSFSKESLLLSVLGTKKVNPLVMHHQNVEKPKGKKYGYI